MADLATIGFKADTKDLSRAATELNKLADTGETTEKRIVNSSKKTGNALSGIGRSAGQAGIQIQQFVGQIQGGQSAMLALSQQGADLGFVLGAPLLGAIVGIGASLAGMLIPSLDGASESFRGFSGAAGTALKEIQDRLKETDQASIASLTQVEVSKLNAEYDKQAKIVADLTKRQNDLFELYKETGSERALADISALSPALEDATEKSEELAKQIAEIVNLSVEAREGWTGANDDTIAKSIESVTSSLEAQLFALVNGANEAELYAAAMMTGADSISELDPTIRQLIETKQQLASAQQAELESARQLDAQRKLEAANAQRTADSYAAQIKALKMQQMQVRMTAEQYEIYAAVQRAIANGAGPEMVDSIIREVQELQNLRAEFEEINDVQESLNLDDFIDDIDRMGGAWSRTGSVIVDAFGNAADKMGDFVKRMGELDKAQQTLNESSLTGQDLTIAQNRLDEERFAANLAGYRSLAGAAGSFFGEQTAARKAFNALEIAMTGAEIALAIQKTAVELGLIQTKTGAKVAEGAASMFAALGPFAWPAIGAMVATMAAFGFSSSGGGGNGTGTRGTALGGGVSDSLDNSNEEMKDIMIDQLAELRGLRSDLASVEGLAYGLFRDLLAVDPGHHEIKNATERALERSFSAMNYGGTGVIGTAPFVDQLRDIFGGINDAINYSLDILSINTHDALAYFVFSVSGISFDDLDPEQAEERLNQILSAQSDLMVESVAPFVTQYQQIGEGALETLVRLAKEQTIFNDHLERTGVNLSGLSSIMQIEVAQSIADLMGGFDAFTDAADEYYEAFFSDQERLAYMQQSLADVMNQLGYSLPVAHDEFRAIVESIDLTTQSGRELYATLLEIAPAMDEYLTQTLENQMDAIDAAYDGLQRAVDAERELLDARLATAQATRDSARAEIEQQIDVLDAQFELLQSNLDFAEQQAQQSYQQAEQALRNAYSAEIDLINDNAAARIAALQDSAQVELQLIQDATSTRIQALNDERQSIQQSASELQSFADGLRDAAGVGSVTLERALQAARSGDFETAMRVNVPTIGADPYSTSSDMALAIAVQRNQVAELANLADAQASYEERMLAGIDAQIEAIQTASELQIDGINDGIDAQTQAIQDQAQQQIAALNAQLNATLGLDTTLISIADATRDYTAIRDALGIDNSIMSVTDAINLLGQEQRALDELNHDEQLATLNEQLVLIDEAYQAEVDFYDTQNALLDRQLEMAQEQLDALNGIDTSIMSVADAMINFSDALAPFMSDIWANMNITPYVPDVSNPNSADNATSTAINELREETTAIQASMAKHQASMVSLLQEIRFDGIDVRVEA